MSKESIKDILDKIGDTAIDAFADSKAEHEESLREEGRREQMRKDLLLTTRMLLSLSIKDEQVYDLLHDYFRVDSLEEIRKYIFEAKVKNQKLALMSCFKTSSDFLSFCKAHDVEKQLNSNPHLLGLSADKLKRALEKQ